MTGIEDDFRNDVLKLAHERFPDLEVRDLVLKVRANFADDDDDEAGQ
jgi:hypothetical protein